jgi:hypothetical protein
MSRIGASVRHGRGVSMGTRLNLRLAATAFAPLTTVAIHPVCGHPPAGRGFRPGRSATPADADHPLRPRRPPGA